MRNFIYLSLLIALVACKGNGQEANEPPEKAVSSKQPAIQQDTQKRPQDQKETPDSTREQDQDRFKKKGFQNLTSTILLRRGVPGDIDPDKLFSKSIPLELNFFSESGEKIGEYDVWGQRPFQSYVGKNLTYEHFNAEMMSVLPQSEQKEPIEVMEYTLKILVKASGKHTIIDYELVSLADYRIFDAKHILRVLDEKGDVLTEIQLDSYDDGAVSSDGKYLLYVYGDENSNTSQSFAYIYEQGWGVVNIPESRVVSKHRKKKNTAFNRVYLAKGGLLSIGYSYPYSKELIGYRVFLDSKIEVIILKTFSYDEFEEIKDYFRNSERKTWKDYLSTSPGFTPDTILYLNE
jgi:hypothetical protein